MLLQSFFFDDRNVLTMKNNLTSIIVVFFVLITNLKSYCTDIPQIPFLKNYTKSDYNARTQNWDIAQDNKDRLYFANNEALLRFDGVIWDKIEMPNKSIVRSVEYYGGDTVVVGAYDEFGIVYNDSLGNMRYQSWVNRLRKDDRNFGEIWRIHLMHDTIILQSFTHIFVFKGGRYLKTIKSDSEFKYSFLIKNKVVVQVANKGLCVVDDETLTPFKTNGFYKDYEVWAIMPYDDSSLIIGTQFSGLFVFDGKTNKVWNTDASRFIKKNNLFCALPIGENRYAFGSIQNGLIIANKEGKILSLINTPVGLQNNTVLCLYEDRSDNLWLGLDNGIDYIKTNIDLSYVRKKGGFGTGYCSIIYDNILYAGTNQGLYYYPLKIWENKSPSVSDFEIIELTRGQVWSLRNIDNILYCGHNNGLFRIDGITCEKVGNVKGVWDIQKVPGNDEFLILGTYDGFKLLSKKTDQVINITGFTESARKFFINNKNEILLSHGYKGIYKLKLNMEQHKIKLLEFYNGSNMLPSDFGNEIFSLGNSILITTENGVYKYNGSSFTEDDIWKKFFNDDASGITSIIEATENKWWCCKNGQLNLITYLNDNMFEVNYKDFLPLKNTFPRSFENILKIDNNDYLIGNEDGFVLYRDYSRKNTETQINISLSSANYKLRGENSYKKLPFKQINNKILLGDLDYSEHRLLLVISTPYYNDQGLVKFRSRINAGPWSSWIEGDELKLDDLVEGDYRLEIQSSIDDNVISGDTLITFGIDPPLYRRWYSYVFYLILFFTLSLIISALMRKRLERERRLAAIKQQKIMIEKQIALKQKAELAQTELVSIKNEKLQQDIRHKSKELANNTMSLIHKNKLLLQFKEILTELKKEDTKFKENTRINQLIKKIDREIDHQDNWVVFEKNFDKVHENFLKRLKETHESLSPRDLRLAAYLRMNLSSKEIAPLLNISIRSIEISRYRLRKKMGLSHDDNLTEYLIGM